MRILIVEDEIKTADYLKKGLSSSGFVVDTAHNGEDGLFLAREHPYDLIVLDVMLPKYTGFEVIAQLRQSNQSVKVLFLTARDDIEDRVKGLELGADDYLIKPFAFSELLARVRTLLRRQENISAVGNKLSYLDLKIDLLKHKAYRGDKALDLTPKEFTLLVLFVQKQGQVLSRIFISERVWDINFDSDTNVVDVTIRRLRQKIDDGFERKLIHTVRGMGYMLE